MITQKTIDEILSRAKIIDLVGEGRSIKRQGKSFVTLCPFHTEKTPSFHLNPEENTFYCFGCQAGGNVFSFVMKERGLSFPEAIEALASRYGIVVEREDKGGGPKRSEQGERRAVLFQVTEHAQRLFRRWLTESSPALEYLAEREITEETIDRFQVGFAPLGGKTLIHALLKEGVREELITASGLGKETRSGLYDTFQGRVLFPIFYDPRRIAGFGGRLVPACTPSEGNYPKYLNSSETEIYKKSQLLFGLAQALPIIRKEKEVFLVEGYLDVLSLAQWGVQNVVATCGTALGEAHAKRLSQLCTRAVLLFDGDRAGRAGAAKSFLSFLNVALDLYAIFLPPEEDPDSFARKHREQTREKIAELPRTSLLQAYLEWRIQELGAQSIRTLGAHAKATLVREVGGVLGEVHDSLVRESYLEFAAEFLSAPRTELLGKAPLGKKSTTSLSEEQRESDAAPVDAHAPSSEPSILDLQELSRIQRDLLIVAMGLRERVLGEILSNSFVVGAFPSSLLRFLHGLQDILVTGEPEERKGKVKNFLEACGPGWVNLWKEAWKRKEAEGDDSFFRLFGEILRALERDKLAQLLYETRKNTREAETPEERDAYLLEQVEIQRKLKRLSP